MVRRIHFSLVLAGSLLVNLAAADDQDSFDVSRAWFKPELQVNREPAVCAPIFRVYSDYFKTRGLTNPLRPIAGRTSEYLEADAEKSKIREIDWTPIGIEDPGNGRTLRLAHWNLNGKYFGIVERGQSIGWRPPTFEYFLIDRQLSDEEILDVNRSHFGRGALGYLRENADKSGFDVIYQSDARFKNFDENIYVGIASVYVHESGRVYLSLTANSARGPAPAFQIIAAVKGIGELKQVCRFTTRPSTIAIRQHSETVPFFTDFKTVVQEIMGGSGNCGTMNSPARAAGELENGLELLIYRPWSLARIPAEMGTEYDFFRWGHSGRWQYKKYQEYLALLPKARQALAVRYARDYQLEQSDALILANAAIREALAMGFDHGNTEDDYHEVHEALLEGRTWEQVPTPPPSADEAKNREADSILTFAVSHPLLVERLLKEGYDPNKTNAFGKTALMYAAQFNDLASAKLLVKYGANLETATTLASDSCNYTIRTQNVTALHYAVRYASRDFIIWLTRAGAVTSVKDSNGHTPLDYLSKFGGFIGYSKTADLAYGQQNPLLTKQQITELARVLTPPGEESLRIESESANQRAESMYRAGKLREAYGEARRSLSLDPKNVKALSNLSLFALKLGYYGESAKAATEAAKLTSSEKERGAAYFNLAQACRMNGDKAYHYSNISHDGSGYCQERSGRYQGPLHFYLKAFQSDPSRARAETIVEFFQRGDAANGKWLCRADEPNANVQAIYVTPSDIYFLARAAGVVDSSTLKLRSLSGDRTIELKNRSDVPLGNGWDVLHWDASVSFQGAIAMDGRLCSRLFPVLIAEDAELVGLYSGEKYKTIAISAHLSKPIVLALYGHNTKWVVSSDSHNVTAIYVWGDDPNVELPKNWRGPVNMQSRDAGGSGNAAKQALGLQRMVRFPADGSRQVELSDETLRNLPPCGGYKPKGCQE